MEKDHRKKRAPTNIIADYGGRVPPQAIELEEAILGAVMLEPNAYLRVHHFFKEDAVLYKESHQKIMNAIRQLYDAKLGIDLLTVTDKLKSNGDLESVGGPIYLTQLTSKVVSAANVEFHCMIVTDKFLLRELIRIGTEMQHRAFDGSIDANEIAEWAEEEMMKKFDLDIEGRASFKDALHSTMMDIANKAKGLVNSFIRTGDPEVDEKLAIRVRQMLLIAGSEGCGKTKFVTYLSKGILDNNDNVRVLWFSMEDSKEQIVRSYISMGSKLTTKQLQSINYKVTDDDLAKINKAVDEFKEYNIEFIDRVCSISTIMRKGKMMREKYKDDILIIIIDNLGLIDTDSFYKGLEKDDYLAGKLKELCDMTDASIFLLHHITKEAAKKFNINDGYRPRKEYIKGSTRILDYVQQAVMVNLPRRYPDLIQEEKVKGELFNWKEKKGPFDKTRFLTEFWSLNPHGDKNTRAITDLQETTWTSLKFACASETLADGSLITVSYLMRKYVEYSIYIEDKNRGRENQYHTEKMALYTFITNKKYVEDYKPQATGRTYYLYGNDLTRAKYIQNLFIAESIKNRDGSNTDDNNIIRYMADLDHNIFKPLNDKGWEELKSTENKTP